MSKKKTTSDDDGKTSGDLEQLRDILYGNQARAIENRLDNLEARSESVRQELSDRLARQQKDQAAQIGLVHEKLEQLDANSVQRLDDQISSLKQQLADFQAEARQRNDDLRQEMLALGAMLDKQKTGREELSQLLIQLAQQIKDNRTKTAASPAKAK